MRSAPKPVQKLNRAARFCIALACAAAALPHTPAQRAYAASVPAAASIIAPASTPLGQNFAFIVEFDNVGSTTGYGPYLNLFMPAAGADGGTNAPNDGIDLISATFLGSAITTFALNCPAGGSVRSPLTELTVACPATPAGTNKLYVLQLPFGSFTAPQAPAVIAIAASLSNLADVGTPLPIAAQAGFIYGDTPTNFEPSQGVSVTTTVAPSLFTLTKTSDEAEGETATGRNYEHVYTITPAMPAGTPAANMLITETLPPDVVLLSIAGASVITGPVIPGGPYAPPNNQIVFNYGSLVGTGAPITLRYVISKTSAPGGDVLPASGGNSTRANVASGSGNWTPVDPRDVGGTFTTTASLINTNRTLALQKNVSDPAPPTRPTDVLTYTLSFQLSDFFSLGNVFITDTFADGQSYVLGSASLSVSERGSSVTGAFPAAALAVTNLGISGTRMVFNLSQALPLLGAVDGVLQGGYAITPTAGPAIGTLTYRVQVSDTYAGGNPLLATDRLSNTAIIAGVVLSNTNLTQVIGQAQDTSAAGFQVLGQPTLSKSFFAINGSTTLPSPLKLSPGDSVTYRITYNIGTGDFNNLTVTDFLPLPIHDAALIAGFISTTTGIPAAGLAQWGPGMTTSDLSRLPLPTLTANPASNGFALGFGSRQDTSNTPTQIDLLFTSQVQNQPFIDDLYLTNQVRTVQTNTGGQVIERNAIVPFNTAAPRVRVRKGILASSNPNSALTSAAGPVAFAPVGVAACGLRFVGTINSTNQAATPMDANLQNADAGDVIRMAILVENIGSALQGAFDVAISDSLPTNMSVVPGSLCVQRGDGSILPTSTPSTSLFTTGITLGVPLSQGVDYAGASNTTGNNLALFTFDVLLGTPISPSQTLTNQARLLNYASVANGANFVPIQLPNTPVTDTAQVSIAPLRFGKQLIGTELSNANNGAAQAVIGELITYTLVLTVPEGTTASARITDTLPTGLAFAACTSVSASSGVASTVALSPAGVCSSDASGTVISLTLGTLTNSDANDAVTETVRITYTAVALNVSANVTGTTRVNNAVFNWQGNTPITATANPITVIEPRLLASKSSNLSFGDAFDQLTFTLIVTNPAANSTDAYDAVLTDVIPSGMSYVAGSLTSVSGPTPTFQIAVPAFTATWPVLAPGQTNVMTFAVTIDANVAPGSSLTNTARLSGTSLPGNVLARTANVSSTERSYTASNASAVFIVSPPTSGKVLISTEVVNAANSNTQVAIGEMLTYTVVITVPEGVTPNARLTDTLDTGLAFVGFAGITASAGLQFANPLGSYLTPTVSAFSGEGGRRGLWTFGTITNTNNNNAISETLRITYIAVVLNVSNNAAGTTRRNSAVFGWSNGNLAAALAANIAIIEPRIGITKSVIPATGDSGDLITYTIVFTGPTSTDAFDATLTDVLPFTSGSSLLLNPVIVSADSNTTPSINAGKFALSGSNSTGYTLTTNGVMQLPLNASRRVTVVVAGTLPVVVVPSAFFTNTAVVNYTSLDGFAQPITRSQYNINSTERVYTATGPAPFRILPLLATKEFITTSESFTGNGPDGLPRATIGEVVAYRLWIQLAESTSPSLTVDFVDNLPVNLEFITGTVRIAFVANGGAGGITSTLVTTSTPGCAGLNVSGSSPGGVLPAQVTCPMPQSAISFDVNGRPRFAFGGVSNFDTDADGEFILVQFNTVVKNVAANQIGVAITNTFNVLINGVQADDSPPITTTIAEPAIVLSKFINALTPTDAGDLITYTLLFTNASGPNASIAFDVVLTDVLDANLDLLSASLNVPANPISYTSAANAVLTTSNALTVSVTQLNPAASATVTVVARVRDATSNGARLPNAAFIRYSSLPTTTGTISNPTGTTTPGASGTITGERTGAGGVNDLFAQSNAVTTTLNTPTIAKLPPTPITYTIGELITYTLVITVPEGVAQAVNVLDDLPSGLIFVSSQVISTSYNGTVPTVTPNLSNGDVLYAFGNMTTTADNQSNNDAFVVQVAARVADVPANTNGALVTNTARLTYTHSISGVTGLSSAQAVRVIEPSLQTSKRATAPRIPAGAGDVVTYTIFVTNTGPAPAFEVAVADALPSGVNFVEPFAFIYSSTSPTTLTSTSTITSAMFNATRLDAGATVFITFTARITDSVGPNQLLTNTTQSTYSSLAGAQTGERNYTTTVATAVVTTGAPALIVSKSATPSPAMAGELLTFTLRVTNTGPVQATNVVMTDRVPNSTTLIAAPGAVLGGGVLSWTQATLTAGSSATQTLTVLVDAAMANGSSIPNTARAQAAEGVSNTATITVPVLARADVAVLKSTSVLTPTLLDTVSFTLIVSNAGPSLAQNVIVTDVLPGGLSFVTATTNLGSYNNTTGRWTIGPMTVGLTTSLQITTRVTSLAVMTNTSTVGANTTDPLTSNNTSSVVITPAARFVDLAINKTAPAGPFYSGQLISYTLAYTNSGSDVAADTFVTDVLPSGAVFVGASAGCAQVGGNATCNVGALGVNASGQITVLIRAPGITTNPSTITNTATITATGETTPTNNRSDANSTIYRLALTSFCSPQPAVYRTWRVTNSGPQDVSFNWLVQATTISGTQVVTNNSEVFFDTPAGGGNVVVISIGGVTHDVKASQGSCPDLTISKGDAPDPLVVGETLTFTLAFTNAGPSDAQNVVIDDPLPSSVTYGGIVAAKPNVLPTVNGNLLSFNIGTLAAGASGEVVFTVTVNLDAGVLITNEATITSTTPDANLLNNTASSNTRVTYADVFVRKDVSPTAPVLTGEVLTWTITYGNAGDAIAREVSLEDMLPNGAQTTNPFTYTLTSTYTSTITFTYTPTPSKAMWQLGELAPGASGQIVFTMTADAATGLDAILINSVLIKTTTPQTNTQNDTARTTNPKLDLGVSKAVARNPVVAGELVSYTLTVYNNGSSALTSVALTDSFDATYVEFVSASRAPDMNTMGQLAWNNLGPIAIDARASVIVTFTTLQPTNGLTTVNVVTATGQFTGSSVLSVKDSAALRITQPVLSVSKTSSANGVVQPGQRITYTLTLTNAGDADALGVSISDTLPANTSGTSFNVSGITLSANSQLSFTYSITASQPLTNGTPIVNTVSVTSSNSAVPTPTATVTDVVGSTHALQITKTAEPAFVVAGGLVTYTLAYAITGNEPAPDVTIADTLPAGVVLVSAVPPSANLMWKLGAVNPPLIGIITVVVSVPSSIPSGTLLANTASITDASGLSAQSSVTTPVLFGTDLNIIKTVEPSVVANGGLITFTLVVSNPGPSDIAPPTPITIPGELANTLGPAQPYPASILVEDDAVISDITVTLAALNHGFAADLDVLLVGPNGQRVLLMSDAGGIHPISDVSLNFHDGAPALPDIDLIQSGAYAPTDYVGNDTIETLPAPAPARPYAELLSIFKGTSAKGEWRLFIYDDQDNDVGGALRGWTLTLDTSQGPKSYSFAQGMRVLDTLPPGFTLVSASSGYAGPNPVAWVDGIRAGETRSYTIIARANRAGSDVAMNTALVTSPLPDLNLSNNTSAAEVRINSASLTVITPTLPSTPTPPGGVLTITLPISNSGNITATGGVITITLPNGEVLVFPIGDIPPGISSTVEITLTLPMLPPGTTATDIVIVVGSDGLDPTPEDNTFVVSVPVDGVPRVALTKLANPPAGSSVRVGDRITYTLIVSNTGAVTATNIVISDATPLNTSYVEGTAQPAPSASNPFVWRVPSLAVGAAFTARFSVVVASISTGPHPITNVAALGGDLMTPTQSTPVLHVYLPSAIQLLRFTAQRMLGVVGGVQVAWTTGAEVNTFGFVLLRSQTGLRANAVRVTDEVIAAKGATGASYEWLDATAQPDVAYIYWLQEIETSGRINEYGPASTTAPDQSQGNPGRVYLPLVVREFRP